MKILIAEDDDIIQQYHREWMDTWGFDFDMASSGLDAVELAGENKGQYDLCLMDVEMPLMNGIDAATFMREHMGYMPIIGMSSNLTYQQQCLDAGMDDFAHKPCHPDELLAKINELAVKSYKLKPINNRYFVTLDMPADQQHAKELRELEKENLRKVSIVDKPNTTVIVHKSTTNKISYDFYVNKQALTTFVNRDPDKPSICMLYKESSYHMPQTLITEEEYLDLLAAEDREMDRYANQEAAGKTDSTEKSKDHVYPLGDKEKNKNIDEGKVKEQDIYRGQPIFIMQEEASC
ncbi:MAG: response regulator [Gammaproteobacteria bacterium]|nr:response regulator [Gammaproteobacteria bacterium]